MSDFDKWFKTEMLPAECDDERVVVGLRLCWDDRQAEIDRLKAENKRLNDYIKQTSPRVDVDLCYTQNARYRMALETIATETIEPAYSTQIATRWRMIAREAVGEVLGEA